MKISMLALCATLVLAMPVGAALAQEDDDPPVDCANAQNQADLTECAYQDYQKADDELNQVYKKAMASQAELDKESADINPAYVGAVAALKKAQRAWIDYRDGHCEGVGYEAAGGTMQPMLEAGCKAQLTNNRVKELKELTKGLGE